MHRGNLLHCFHLEVKKWDISSRVLFSKNAHPSYLGRSLLEGNKGHLLTRQEHQVGSLNNCISESQQHAYAQRLELQDAQHGYIESRREQVRLQEELSLKDAVLRDTQIRSMHEIGEMKRAQELRVDEISVQKLTENRETIQKLSSQLRAMQDQMNSLSDSGEFSRNGIKLQWEIVLRFQSTCNDAKFSFHAELRQTSTS